MLAGGLWALAGWAGPRVAERVGPHRARAAPAVVLGAIAVLGVGVALLSADKGIDEIGDQYDAFTELQPVEDGSRFASGGGNRYDYWRVAVDQFEEDPLRGEGAGNYDRDYFLERRTTEDVRQAHSIELQIAGELGVVGLLALIAFAGSVLWAGASRARRVTYRDRGEVGLIVAAGGAFTIWLFHTSVDWLHLIPGLTGIALCAAAALLALEVGELRMSDRRVRLAAAGAVVVVVAAAAFFVGRLTLADQLREDGYDALDSDPQEALEKARDSLDLNDDAVPTYYLEASALARLGDYDAAREALLEATRLEPGDFVTWGLLGDLATRRGDLEAAREYYGRASELNPRDESLKALSAG